jgi:RNA polymerase sigma-70 factor (ECF subfamily)
MMDSDPPYPPSPANRGFEEVVVPHLDAAYRLARWLVRNEHDAEDIVQEASLRALRYFRTFSGGNGRAWFLTIVRTTTCGWRRRGFQAPTDAFDEEQHSSARPMSDPESVLLHTDDVALIKRAMRTLPDRFRELLVLREREDLSYRELADVMEVPIGTVMSGLSRARQAFRIALDNELKRSGMSTTTVARVRHRTRQIGNREITRNRRLNDTQPVQQDAAYEASARRAVRVAALPEDWKDHFRNRLSSQL